MFLVRGILLILQVLAPLYFCSNSDKEEKKNERFNEDFLYELMDRIEGATGQKTFYSLFGVPDTANQQQIGSAFRRLSTEWHPDRSKRANAKEVYPLLSSVYSVLQDTEPGGGKELHEWILNDAPHWHRDAFRARRKKQAVSAKIGIWQAIFILLAAVQVAEYLGFWCRYGYNRWVESQEFGDLSVKQKMKKRQTAPALGPKPSVLQCTLVRFSLALINAFRRKK